MERLSLVAASQGCTLRPVLGLLIVVASLVAEHGLKAHRLNSRNMWAP